MNALDELKKRVDENPLGAPDIEYFIVNTFNDARTCRHIQENAAQELVAKDAELARLRQIEAAAKEAHAAVMKSAKVLSGDAWNKLDTLAALVEP